MELELPQDFKEFLSLLRDREVEYLLIGGYAGLAHLKQNKQASGRHKDLDDLDHLP